MLCSSSTSLHKNVGNKCWACEATRTTSKKTEKWLVYRDSIVGFVLNKRILKHLLFLPFNSLLNVRLLY